MAGLGGKEIGRRRIGERGRGSGDAGRAAGGTRGTADRASKARRPDERRTGGGTAVRRAIGPRSSKDTGPARNRRRGDRATPNRPGGGNCIRQPGRTKYKPQPAGQEASRERQAGQPVGASPPHALCPRAVEEAAAYHSRDHTGRSPSGRARIEEQGEVAPVPRRERRAADPPAHAAVDRLATPGLPPRGRGRRQGRRNKETRRRVATRVARNESRAGASTLNRAEEPRRGQGGENPSRTGTATVGTREGTGSGRRMQTTRRGPASWSERATMDGHSPKALTIGRGRHQRAIGAAPGRPAGANPDG
jgi:hypothetical protein